VKTSSWDILNSRTHIRLVSTDTACQCMEVLFINGKVKYLYAEKDGELFVAGNAQ